ncbi:hypothetical protein [Xanthomonas virus PB119]|nr:hypothetical protein [Xanthomonas virus PB119]
MSKTIYLDGTETLVFTRSLVEPTFIPDGPLNRWEIMLLECIMQAGIYPGQMIVFEYQQVNNNPHTWPDYRSMERLAYQILNSLGIRNPNIYEMRVEKSWFSLRLRNSRNREEDHYLSYRRIYLEKPPWHTTKFTP